MAYLKRANRLARSSEAGLLLGGMGMPENLKPSSDTSSLKHSSSAAAGSASEAAEPFCCRRAGAASESLRDLSLPTSAQRQNASLNSSDILSSHTLSSHFARLQGSL